jgi:corrinoid protein of di/trimethylamine methyltransferase
VKTSNDAENVLSAISDAVVNFNVDNVKKAVQEALNNGLDPLRIMEEGLAKGARVMGDRFANGDAFLTELFLSAEAMKAGVEILKPHMSKKSEKRGVAKVILCTVKGDIHDIGKNIVGVLLESAGFEVIDLGVDVSAEKIAEKTAELKPRILGMSALLSTTAPEQAVAIGELKKRGLRGSVKVIVGGTAVTEEWAKEIGADGYAADASAAVGIVKSLAES